MGTDRAKTRWKQDLVAYLMNIHLLNKLYIRIIIYPWVLNRVNPLFSCELILVIEWDESADSSVKNWAVQSNDLTICYNSLRIADRSAILNARVAP